MEKIRDIVTGYSVAGEEAILYHTSGSLSLAAGEQLAYTLSAQRWCIGYEPPAPGGDPQDGLELSPVRRSHSCPERAPASMGAQCDECLRRSAYQPCVSCVGFTCANPARRNQCVFADHYLYLAAYDQEVVKVGVTKIERFHTRIREQGALGAIAIGIAGGLEVRRMERMVMKAGWPDRVKMLPFLTHSHGEPRALQEHLRAEARRVAVRLPELSLLQGGPWVWCADYYPAPLSRPPRTLSLGGDPLAGTVLGHRGGLLVLQLGDQLLACTLRGLVGRELVPDQSALAGPAQVAFAI